MYKNRKTNNKKKKRKRKRGSDSGIGNRSRQGGRWKIKTVREVARHRGVKEARNLKAHFVRQSITKRGTKKLLLVRVRPPHLFRHKGTLN
jgi:hypothetical protein